MTVSPLITKKHCETKSENARSKIQDEVCLPTVYGVAEVLCWELSVNCYSRVMVLS